MPGAPSNRKLVDVSVAASKIHGLGVFANRAFARDEIVLDIDDSDAVLDRRRLTPEQEIFIDVFVAVNGQLKTTWMKSPERFINHSCEPNTYVLTEQNSGVRQVRARQKIRPGEELTWDYALNIWEEWIGPLPCHCGAGSCRGSIRGNYFTLPRDIQRKYLPLLDGPFKQRFAQQLQSPNLGPEPDAERPARRAGRARANQE